MWPITATAGPIAAYNLSLILAPAASAWATFILARRLTGKFWPALFAGFVFGFCAYEITHEGFGPDEPHGNPADPAHRLSRPARGWDGSLGRRGFLIWMALRPRRGVLHLPSMAFADLTLIAPIALVIGYVGRGTGHTAQGWSGWPVDCVIAYVREHCARGAVPVTPRWPTSPSRSTRRCRSSGWTWQAWSCRGTTGCSG